MKMAMKFLAITVCLFVICAALISRAEATPVKYGDNYYGFVQVSDPFTGNNNSWATDSANAAASLYDGMSGHLATVTSQGENDFLFSLVSGSFSGFKGAWWGGKAPEGWLEIPEVGQNFIYTNWVGGKLNNSGYVYMNKRY